MCSSSRIAKSADLATLVPVHRSKRPPFKDVKVFPRSILTNRGETAHRAEADERSTSQATLILGYLALFPAETGAVETYEHFCRYADSLPSSIRSKSRIVVFLEKFVLWAICIARKPLSEFSAPDLRAFSAFCARPPVAWIGGRNERFVIDKGTERHNEDWKPFLQSIADPARGYVTNRFFKYLSSDLGVQPRLSSSEFYKAPRAPFSGQDDSQAQQYLQYLANLTPASKVSERSLFVFSVCYHLRLSFKEWRSERSHFSMACFSSMGSSDPHFTMRGDMRDYNIAIPQALIDSIIRYRNGLGLSSIPSLDDGDPILTEALLDKLMWRLPKMPGVGRSPSELLDRAVGFRISQLDTPAPAPAPAPSGSESSRQYRLSWERKQVSKSRRAVHHQDSADLDTGYHTQERPPPLFGMQQREVLLFSTTQGQAYVSRCFPANCCKIALESLEILRAYRSCSADRLKLIALEKLLLWSVCVKHKSFYSLTPLDAREFYEFCLAPPSSWTGNYPQTRLGVGDPGVLPNPDWTPFRISGGDKESGIRAGRIMDWCYNVYNSLLVIESVKLNIFSGLMD